MNSGCFFAVFPKTLALVILVALFLLGVVVFAVLRRLVVLVGILLLVSLVENIRSAVEDGFVLIVLVFLILSHDS